MPHLPAPGRPVPVSTYRVQLRPGRDGAAGFGFDDAAGIAPYLSRLGVTHLYCSPYLQAAPGSAHGYDVVDHSRLNDELGGPDAFDRMVAACREAGLGLVLDIVPNHMAISAPESQNAAWWSLLREGPASPYASWFDVDWHTEGGRTPRVLVPVLASPLAECLEDLRLGADRIHYFEHEFPLAPSSMVEGDIRATLEAQHYELCHWRVARERLNYRRFFDVTTLAGVRVEAPEVFDATHRVILQQVADGVLDGLRVDHPDGLADPEGYLARLADCTTGSWVVVEKILEPGEELPATWRCSGTTGYDALNRVTGLFVDPSGEAPLTELWHSFTGDLASYDDVVAAAKSHVLTDVLGAEVARLTAVARRALEAEPGAAAVPPGELREALTAVLAAFEVYRAYLPPTGAAGPEARKRVEHALALAVESHPSHRAAVSVIGRLVLGEGPNTEPAREFVTRFQQTCGPVMAKGVEDTAFYRYLRLSALNEVGGDPGTFGIDVAAFHAACLATQRDWPLTMTALSTHDTKRSEDVRARLALLSELPGEWAALVQRCSSLAAPYRDSRGPAPAAEYLLWQTLVGAWPIATERAVAYLEKATREAKVHTSWIDPNPAYDDAVAAFVRGVLADPDIAGTLSDFVEMLAAPWRVTSLAHKLIQLTMPGVADSYQGTELWDLSLVDPDNRRPVDYTRRAKLLAELADGPPALDDTGVAKLHVVSQALRLRREQPETFLAQASYVPLDAGPRAIAFSRSDAVVTVAPLRAVSVAQHGWGDDVLTLPAGQWRDRLTGARRPGGETRLDHLLSDFPVALLTREPDA
ncbi:MAG TPA: malto-oligosyltrehalose synthase [Mycobacteriales bacterium]|nr:malto-oligosyltrehalose synthase [Mycobacteriales bacterium]